MMVTRVSHYSLQSVPYSIDKNDRTELKAFISKYWLGLTKSQTGTQGVKLVDGRLICNPFFGRMDIFVIQWSNTLNAFIDPDGYVQIDLFSDVSEISSEERQFVLDICKKTLKDNYLYVKRQNEWFDTAPWMALEGLTPEESIAKLDSLGW